MVVTNKVFVLEENLRVNSIRGLVVLQVGRDHRNVLNGALNTGFDFSGKCVFAEQAVDEEIESAKL